ncbi:MAG: hypothetical protein AAFO73_08610 [Pseudomonadota bacterium]
MPKADLNAIAERERQTLMRGMGIALGAFGALVGAGLGGWAVYGGEIQLAYLADAIMRCF